jgi:hypothetical protein
MAHKPPRVHPASRPVQLKRTVDIQLEQAFYDGQWTSAANLARQRHKSTKDEYYKVGFSGLFLSSLPCPTSTFCITQYSITRFPA